MGTVLTHGFKNKKTFGNAHGEREGECRILN